MRMKIIFLALLVLATVIPFIASSAVPDTANDNPEFYFTRLRYRENGMRARGTMAKPEPYHCPEFGGGRFFPPQGWGWATDYPGAGLQIHGGNSSPHGSSRVYASKYHRHHGSGTLYLPIRIHRRTGRHVYQRRAGCASPRIFCARWISSRG